MLPCGCPAHPPGTLCSPPSPNLSHRIYQAINDKAAWRELVCLLIDLCAGLESVSDAVEALGDAAAYLAAPSVRSATAGNNYREIGSVFYDFARYSPSAAKSYRFWFDAGGGGAANHTLQVRRESDGALLGAVAGFSASGPYTVLLASNLPTADDALYVQIKKSGGGNGGEVVAGVFIFE